MADKNSQILNASKSQAEQFCNRSSFVVTAIKEYIYKKGWHIDEPEKVCGVSLKSIEDLDIYLFTNFAAPNEPVNFQPGDLAGLSGLKRLTIRSDKPIQLPSGLFDDLSSLEALSLNDGIEASPGLFKNLSSLKFLSLNGDAYSKLPNLLSLPDSSEGIALILNSTNITHLPDDTLPPNVLSEFKYQNNPILKKTSLQRIAPRFFRNQSQLKKIDITPVTVDALSDETFYGLSALEELTLDGGASEKSDKISKAVLPNLFKGLASLKVLTLQNNFVKNVPQNWFKDLSALDRLNFNNNYVQVLPSDFLSGADNIRIVYMRFNDLTALSPELEERLRYVKYIDLTGNNLPKTNFDLPTVVCTGTDGLHSVTVDKTSLQVTGNGPRFGENGITTAATKKNTSDPFSGTITYYSIDLAPWNQPGSVHALVQASTTGIVGKIRKTSAIGCSWALEFQCQQKDDISLTCIEK